MFRLLVLVSVLIGAAVLSGCSERESTPVTAAPQPPGVRLHTGERITVWPEPGHGMQIRVVGSDGRESDHRLRLRVSEPADRAGAIEIARSLETDGRSVARTVIHSDPANSTFGVLVEAGDERRTLTAAVQDTWVRYRLEAVSSGRSLRTEVEIDRGRLTEPAYARLVRSRVEDILARFGAGELLGDQNLRLMDAVFASEELAERTGEWLAANGVFAASGGGGTALNIVQELCTYTDFFLSAFCTEPRGKAMEVLCVILRVVDVICGAGPNLELFEYDMEEGSLFPEPDTTCQSCSGQ